MRVASNIGWGMDRQLGRAFNNNTNALNNVDPNTLNGGKPSKGDAMAVAGVTGTVSFVHDAGAQINITVWAWEEIRNKWDHLGPVASVYTQAVDSDSIATITAKENQLLFFQGSAVANNFWTGGARRYDLNPTKDLLP